MNKNIKDLVNYVDGELLDVLTDNQRDHIVGLATAALVVDERIASREEINNSMLAAARRETPITGPIPSNEFGFWYGVKQHVKALGLVLFVISVITGFVILQ